MNYADSHQSEYVSKMFQSLRYDRFHDNRDRCAEFRFSNRARQSAQFETELRREQTLQLSYIQVEEVFLFNCCRRVIAHRCVGLISCLVTKKPEYTVTTFFSCGYKYLSTGVSNVCLTDLWKKCKFNTASTL